MVSTFLLRLLTIVILPRTVFKAFFFSISIISRLLRLSSALFNDLVISSLAFVFTSQYTRASFVLMTFLRNKSVSNKLFVISLYLR